MAEETNKIIHDGDAASKILLAPTGFVPRERRGVAAQHPPPAASVRRNRRRAAMLSLVTLLCPPSSSRSGGGIETSSFEVVGLVNVAPPIAGSRPTAPMRGGGLGCRRNAPFFNSPDATTMTDSTALSPQVAAAAANQTTGYAPPRTNQKTDEQVPPRKNDGKQIQRRRVWMPPSQNPGKIFSIQQPQDLLDFVIEDERLSVVKVYASWCKTCQVFDMRYRRLASQFGDDRSGDGGGGGAQITKFGRARFAEMQYDNPNNKEMCQLLNATKLPYILMYKGSKGKVDEFQCSPAEFQHLIDAVNELADPAVAMEGDTSKENEMSDNFDELEVADTLNATATTAAAAAAIAQELSSTGDETIDGLKKQLEKELAEKFEMFEIMKAQIEYDKEYVLKLETGVETQRSMIEAKDGELSILQSLLKSNENAMLSLSTELSQQQEETQRAKQDLSMYQPQVSQLTSRISQIESTVASIELESSFNEKLAREKERQLLRRTEEWDELKNSYEKERSSLRQLAVLGVKRVGRGARYFLLRLMRKKID